MKNFLYKLPIWVTVFSVLVCTLISLPLGASAASFVTWDSEETLSSPDYYDEDFNVQDNAAYSGTLYAAVAGDLMYMTPKLTPGSYLLSGVNPAGKLGTDTFPLSAVLIVYPDEDGSSPYPVSISFNLPFTIEDGTKALLIAQSYDVPPVLESLSEPLSPEPLYYSAFQMFADFIYGENAVLTAEQNMTLTILATLAALFVVLFPFLIVFFVVRFISWLR